MASIEVLTRAQILKVVNIVKEELPPEFYINCMEAVEVANPRVLNELDKYPDVMKKLRERQIAQLSSRYKVSYGSVKHLATFDAHSDDLMLLSDTHLVMLYKLGDLRIQRVGTCPGSSDDSLQIIAFNDVHVFGMRATRGGIGLCEAFFKTAIQWSNAKNRFLGEPFINIGADIYYIHAMLPEIECKTIPPHRY